MGKKKAGARKDAELVAQQDKKREREAKITLKKEKKRKQFQRDAEWESNFKKLEDQLDPLGLVIKDVKADGNCLFRTTADQLFGTPDTHAEVRKSCMDFIEVNREGFEPFIEDDEPFDEYCTKMRKDREWGGHLEIQALSLCYSVNIVIHQLAAPRWEVNNFPQTSAQRVLHFSYHDGMHYASVRPKGSLDGPPDHSKTLATPPPAGPRAAITVAKGDSKGDVSVKEKTIMDATGVRDLVLVRETLTDNQGDVDATIDFLTTMRYQYGMMDTDAPPSFDPTPPETADFEAYADGPSAGDAGGALGGDDGFEPYDPAAFEQAGWEAEAEAWLKEDDAPKTTGGARSTTAPTTTTVTARSTSPPKSAPAPAPAPAKGGKGATSAPAAKGTGPAPAAKGQDAPAPAPAAPVRLKKKDKKALKRAQKAAASTARAKDPDKGEAKPEVPVEQVTADFGSIGI